MNENPINKDEMFTDKLNFDQFNELEKRIKIWHDSICGVNKDQKMDFETYNQLALFVNLLRDKFPDFHTYSLYHIVSGSTISNKSRYKNRQDFPGDYSIEKFMNMTCEERDNLIKRLSKK